MKYGWAGHYSFRCQPVDYSDSPLAIGVSAKIYFYFLFIKIKLIFYFIQMTHASWWYYFSKFTEFFDTVTIAKVYVKKLEKIMCFLILFCSSSSCCAKRMIRYLCFTSCITGSCRWASGSVCGSHREATHLSLGFSTLSSTLLCISITWWPPWDLNTPNLSGGRNI